MTCIVGLRTEAGVLLGGDSLGSNGYSGNSYHAPKVFRLSRQVAAGFTSSFRMGQLIQHHLQLPPLAGDELAWAIKTLVPVIRETFKTHGYAHIEHNTESGGTFLLAVRDRLFTVQNDYSVLEAREPYDAVGSGEAYAVGAMHALWKPNLTRPRRFLTAALDAASAYAVGVAPPYSFTSTTR
jgi:ATP-dependent protease HslVU (ClpYQ) peptidase subunit